MFFGCYVCCQSPSPSPPLSPLTIFAARASVDQMLAGDVVQVQGGALCDTCHFVTHVSRLCDTFVNTASSPLRIVLDRRSVKETLIHTHICLPTFGPRSLYTPLQASARTACLRAPTTTQPKCSPSNRPLPHMRRHIHQPVKCQWQWQSPSPRAGRPARTRLGAPTTRTTRLNRRVGSSLQRSQRSK